MSKRHLYLLALILAAMGLSLFAYKAFWLKFPLRPQERSYVWNVEAMLKFQAKGGPVKVSLAIPSSTRQFAIMDEQFVSRAYGVNTVEEEGRRQAVWSIRKAQDNQTVYYRVVVLRSLRDPAPARIKPPPLPPHGFSGAGLEAAKSLLATVHARSADLDTMVGQLFERLNNPRPGTNLPLLLGKNPTQARKVELAVRLLSLAGVAARSVHGLHLAGEQRRSPLLHWIEVFDGKAWRCFDPQSGQPKRPADFLVWWRGTSPLVKAEGADRPRVVFSVTHNLEASLSAAVMGSKQARTNLLRFSLFSLPVTTQQVYRVLLLLPVGAFILIILRNLVGISTIGTFMPVLIALSFRETRLWGGITLFFLVVALGLAARLYMERLKLLVVPRLAAVLIVVVFVMAALSVLSHQLGFHAGLSVALFPMVILTMTIERLSIAWEERGPAQALKQALGSLLAAALAYLVMNINEIGHLVFVFPELILLILAATLILGRYSGFRLLELRRFKVLAAEKN